MAFLPKLDISFLMKKQKLFTMQSYNLILIMVAYLGALQLRLISKN